jgi:hypothetical protein
MAVSSSNAFAPLPTASHRLLSQQLPSLFNRLSLPTVVHMVSKSSAPPTPKKKRKAGNNKRKEHDRTVDRRKSPALWRDNDDLESLIAPAAASATEQQQTEAPKFLPKEPPELMSPAGGWPQLKAAVANGADAVYLGLTSYSARARAANFDPDPTLLLEGAEDEYTPIDGQPASLAHAVKFAHKHHVRIYVAFNTLVFDQELPEVQGLIEQVWDCGVDAVIIQDVGVAKIVKEVVDQLSMRMEQRELGKVGKGLNGAPLEIHASTQQSVTCADGVSFAAERTNATRVVRSYLSLQPLVYSTLLDNY